MKKFIFSMLGILVFGFIIWGFIKKQDSILVAPIKKVTTEIVELQVSNKDNTFGSFVNNSNESIVSAQIGGNIAYMHVKEGDNVKKGQLLMSISAPEISAQYQQANTNVQITAEQEKLARRKWDDLKPEERIQFKLQTKQANEARVEAGAFLAKTSIVAPFDGVVSKKFVKQGTTVLAGTQLIRIIGEEQNKEVNLDIPVYLNDAVSIGNEILVTNDDKYFKATIIAVSPMSDELSRKISVRATLEQNATFDLGEFVDVIIKDAVDLEGSGVQRESIVKKYEDEFVFVINDNIAHMKKINVIGDDGDYVIVENIMPGEEVIVSGAHEVRDGEIVDIINQ